MSRVYEAFLATAGPCVLLESTAAPCRLDANILIRSAVVAGGRVTFHAGGGIVADSDADREYEETLHKAEGLKLALEAVLDGRG